MKNSMKWIRIRWEKGTRYYEVYLHQDLWGGWVLARVWGRRGTQWGQIRNRPCGSYEQGLAEMDQVRELLERHEYRVVEDVRPV